jgi:formylglycine-generating enzyme required for sulfatase activity
MRTIQQGVLLAAVVGAVQCGGAERTSVTPSTPRSLDFAPEPDGRKEPRASFRAADLEWQKQPAPNEMNWEDAKSYCQGLALAGGGWRLPSKDELLALYATKSSGTASFPGMDAGGYWSSSAVAGSSGYAWDVSFYGGYTNGDGVGYGYRVRCVR